MQIPSPTAESHSAVHRRGCRIALALALGLRRDAARLNPNLRGIHARCIRNHA